MPTPRTLLATTCSQQPDGSYISTSTYYDPARRAAQQAPLVSEDTPAFACSPYQIAPDVQLEAYCAVDDHGQGILRTVYSQAGGSGVVQFYRYADSQSDQCNGACDLALTYQAAVHTSGSGAHDGQLVLEANTSHLTSATPGLTCYVPTLGSPTRYTQFNAAPPYLFQFVYANVPAGSYKAQLQDGNNCRATSNVLVVNDGEVTVGGDIDWVEYEYKDQGLNTPQLTGYAWDRTLKHLYLVEGLNIDYPRFNVRESFYPKGSIVYWPYQGAQRYFRAKLDLYAAPSGDNVTPQADELGLANWELVNDGYHYEINGARYTIAAFNGQVNTPQLFFAYAQGSIVRYRYNNFYRAKQALDGSHYYNRPLPFPSVGISNDYWEYLPGYSLFTYAVPEDHAVDTYQVGAANRRVTYYVANPAAPTLVPTATVVLPGGEPGDYVLLNDTVPGTESSQGDLQLLDLTVHNVHEQGTATGSAAVLADSPSLPLSFYLTGPTLPAGYPQASASGIFEQLPAGHYQVDISDAANRHLLVDFDVEDRYRLRWRLQYDDLRGSPLETRVYQRDWAGPVTDVVGTGRPGELSWTSGGDRGGSLAESLGAVFKFNLRTQLVQQFLDTALYDDHLHRVEHYRGGQLRFRGYIDSTSYREPLLGPGQEVTLEANCGLGGLKNDVFVNFYGQRQTARATLLSTVLKVLSYCDVNLPVYCGLNLREKLMAADADPLAAAWAHRNAYQKKDGKYLPLTELIDPRTVLDAILRLFNAQLFQADGAWHIVGLNEVTDLRTAVRTWSPAGTLLATGTSPAAPLRVLPPLDATGPRELYWLRAEQAGETYAAVQLATAVADVKLETSLFDNGDFARWDGQRPTNWVTQGGLALARANGENAYEYAARFSGYDTVFSAGSYLLSPAVPHLAGEQEDYLRLALRAKVEPANANVDATPSTLTLFVQVVCDGVPYLDPLPVPMSSKDGWKDYALDLPLGLPGSKVRVRLIEPVLDQGVPASSLLLASAYLRVQPGLTDWSKLDQQRGHPAENVGVTSGIMLPDVEVAHADLPLLPALNGGFLPALGMDVLAWRHALSYADNTPTTRWKRPADLQYAPLLDCVALDRASLRDAPVPFLTGEVAGPGMRYLRVGMVLDFPADLDGLYYLTDVAINEREGSARITARKLAPGVYDGAYPVLPANYRAVKVLGRPGHRVSVVGGVTGVRVVQP